MAIDVASVLAWQLVTTSEDATWLLGGAHMVCINEVSIVLSALSRLISFELN